MEHFYKWRWWFGRFLFSINVKLHVLLILFLQEYEESSSWSWFINTIIINIIIIINSIIIITIMIIIYFFYQSLCQFIKIPNSFLFFFQTIPLTISLYINMTPLPPVPFSSWPPSPSCKRPVWPSSFPAPSPSSWPWLWPSSLPFPLVQADQQTSRQLLAWPLSPSQS